MIDTKELTAVGKVLKTHGVNGEVSVSLYNPDRADLCDLQRVVFFMDGIPVPFFIRSCRPRGAEGCLVAFDDVDSQEQAEQFGGMEVFAFNDDMPEGDHQYDDYLTLDDLVGYTIVDTDGTTVGTISDIDDATENVLFLVDTPDGRQVHVPAAEPLITDVDPEKQVLTMNLPTGLI